MKNKFDAGGIMYLNFIYIFTWEDNAYIMLQTLLVRLKDSYSFVVCYIETVKLAAKTGISWYKSNYVNIRESKEKSMQYFLRFYRNQFVSFSVLYIIQWSDVNPTRTKVIYWNQKLNLNIKDRSAKLMHVKLYCCL
jgi:hypothetical protein